METIIGMIENKEEEDRKDPRLDPRITIIQAKDVDHDAKRSIAAHLAALVGPHDSSLLAVFSMPLIVTRNIRTRAYGNGIERYYPSSLVSYVTECDFLTDPTIILPFCTCVMDEIRSFNVTRRSYVSYLYIKNIEEKK